MSGPMPKPEMTASEVLKNLERVNLSVREIFGLPEPYLHGTSRMGPSIEERLAAVEEKIDTLLRKLELIFGNAVLLKGRFIELKDLDLR